MTTLTATQFAALTPTVPVDATGNQSVSVTIASAPKVTFALTNGAGGPPIKGFGSTSLSATATVASYPNLAFSLAKLVPGTGTVPSKWVTYIVTSVPTKNATTGVVTAAAPRSPTTDSTGTLVDNGNGTYTYTFFRDVTKIKDDVANMPAVTAPNNKADLGDLTYDPNLVHRLTIQISGNVPGTGSNTANAVTDPAKPAVPMSNPANVVYDFIPATGQAVAASGREIASTAKCNECHQFLGGFPEVSTAVDARFHGGSRNEVRYCVMCHNDQLLYGHAEAVVDAAGNYDGRDTFKINGLSVGTLSSHTHKIHMSSLLSKTGYEVGIAYEEACKFPQDIRNCTKCHDGTAGASNATAQGDNWMKVPNRVACGACHDGINFATGGGITLADSQLKKAGLPTTGFAGHIGGAKADDSQCALCHDATTIPVNHIPITPPSRDNFLAGGTNKNTNASSIASNSSRLPAGAIKVSYEISSVSLNASRNPVMVFRMLQNGAAVPFKTFVAPATSDKEIWDNFMGAPSLYFVYAIPQDGIARPADFNASASVYLRSLWNGTVAGTLVGPDATTGMYTATLTTITIPANAVMVTGGLGYSYNNTTTLPLTQTNLTDFPTTASTVAGLTANMPNKTGGLIVIAPDQQKVVTSFTGRRTIVEDARCNKCHLELGPFTEDAFHAGQRNDGTTCSWCHTPNRTSQGWSVDSTSFIHAIHAAAKLNPIPQPFTYDAISATDGFFTIGYPGVLNNCETCHTPTGYDFSSADATAALANRLYRTVATGTFDGAADTNKRISPYVVKDNVKNYGTGYSTSTGAGTIGILGGGGTADNLVNSPIATACFACHATVVARQHMESNGGSIYAPRGTAAVAGGAVATGALAKAEQCMFCHSSTSAFGLGIKAVHAAK